MAFSTQSSFLFPVRVRGARPQQGTNQTPQWRGDTRQASGKGTPKLCPQEGIGDVLKPISPRAASTPRAPPRPESRVGRDDAPHGRCSPPHPPDPTVLYLRRMRPRPRPPLCEACLSGQCCVLHSLIKDTRGENLPLGCFFSPTSRVPGHLGPPLIGTGVPPAHCPGCVPHAIPVPRLPFYPKCLLHTSLV